MLQQKNTAIAIKFPAGAGAAKPAKMPLNTRDDRQMKVKYAQA